MSMPVAQLRLRLQGLGYPHGVSRLNKQELIRLIHRMEANRRSQVLQPY